MMNNNTTANVSESFRTFAQSVIDRAAQAYATGKMTTEECVESCDKDIDVLKGSFFASVETISRLTGVHTLHIDIARVFERGCNENTGKKELYRMAKEVRAIVDEKIAALEDCWMTDNADVLRKAFHEDSLIETFVKSVTWLVGKLWKKLRKIAGYVGLHVDEKSILGTVCKGIGALAHLVNAGAKVVVSIAKYAVSIVGAGALLIADYLWMGICWLFKQFKKLWNKAKDMLIPADVEFADDFELDADFSTETEENNAQ